MQNPGGKSNFTLGWTTKDQKQVVKPKIEEIKKNEIDKDEIINEVKMEDEIKEEKQVK